MALTVSVSDEGQITFMDENGAPVGEDLINRAKKQQGELIMGLIHKTCADINGQVSALGELHLDTPDPTKQPIYRAKTFDTPPPRTPIPKVPGFIAGLFKNKRKRIEDQNATEEASYQAVRKEWAKAKEDFEVGEMEKKSLVSRAVAGDPEAMEEFFGEVLLDIVWPRETEVSFEVRDGGTRLVFDVDLPEVEEMPSKTASVPQRGYRLSVKAMGQTAVQKLYAAHIHSIAFRLLGEAFGMLPKVQEVTLSAYSQRKSKTTGHEADEYLLSVVASREEWEGLNFGSLDAIDVTEALTTFNIRREMSKTGIFKAIEPF